MGKTEIEETVNRFSCDCNCAQTLLLTYGVPEGINEETILRIFPAFGSGFVEQGEVCGAVTGAVMAIGLKYGMTKRMQNF